jgi:hypothetical protein
VSKGEALGTIWIVSHDEDRRFDAEDVRVMESLASCTAAALCVGEIDYAGAAGALCDLPGLARGVIAAACRIESGPVMSPIPAALS